MRGPPRPDLLSTHTTVVTLDKSSKQQQISKDSFSLEAEAIVSGCLEAAAFNSPASRGVNCAGASGKSVENIVKAVSQLRRAKSDMLEEMCIQLGPSPVTIHSRVFEVFDGIFDDGTINCGRILVFLAFGAHLASYCEKRQLGDTFDSLKAWITSFLHARLKGWIVAHGGWVSSTFYSQSRKLFQLPSIITGELVCYCWLL